MMEIRLNSMAAITVNINVIKVVQNAKLANVQNASPAYTQIWEPVFQYVVMVLFQRCMNSVMMAIYLTKMAVILFVMLKRIGFAKLNSR